MRTGTANLGCRAPGHLKRPNTPDGIGKTTHGTAWSKERRNAARRNAARRAASKRGAIFIIY
eukprot:730780-Lingulodinium_polyedra.AAC.1